MFELDTGGFSLKTGVLWLALAAFSIEVPPAIGSSWRRSVREAEAEAAT